MSKPEIKVGAYIKFYCSRCKLELGHTIAAVMHGQPVRVRCDTCKTERNYRAKKMAERVLKATPKQISRPKLHHPDLYRQKLNEASSQTAKRYRMDESFSVGELVDHVKFGRGIVLKIIPPDRVDILFQDETRTLACQISLSS